MCTISTCPANEIDNCIKWYENISELTIAFINLDSQTKGIQTKQSGGHVIVDVEEGTDFNASGNNDRNI